MFGGKSAVGMQTWFNALKMIEVHVFLLPLRKSGFQIKGIVNIARCSSTPIARNWFCCRAKSINCRMFCSGYQDRAVVEVGIT